jgi:hypothetical protein
METTVMELRSPA